MVDERFEGEYLKMCTEDPREASLFALSTLAMRHINDINREYFVIIHRVLFNNELTSPEMNKVKGIVRDVLEYDDKLIENMKNIEIDICNMLYDIDSCNMNNDSKVERQRQIIKKWWE